MIRQRLVAGLVTATALVTLAACGSDKKSSSTTQSVATDAPAATASEATAPGTAVTSSNPASGVSTPDMSVPDVSVPDISVPELTGECVELQQELGGMASATNFSTADVEKSFETLEAKVPDDLKDDVRAMKTSLQPFYDAVEKAGGDVTKAMQDPEVIKTAQAAVTDPKFTAASTALNDWFTKGCPS
jgi:hypothetical protein